LPDGGYVLSGTSSSGISGDKSEDCMGEDFWLVRIDEQGNKVWDETIGGLSFDFNAATILTSAGNYTVAGYSSSSDTGDKTEFSRGDFDYWVVEVSEPLTAGKIGFTLVNAATNHD